ncbi:Conserved_hypothetical protein [Hexamita inflata]|uniref:Uncharacterized protein n=1 Tax=Hexamita inflata TaxID=28002 RepID=A0AA86UP05_9EUKA|nr:Conserved hypothetical protein [Hexamita inflata]
MTQQHKYVQYTQSKHLGVTWIQLSYAVKNIVEKIMMPPQQNDEYLMKIPINHVLFKQGRFFGNDYMSSLQSIIYHTFISSRYSYSLDYWCVTSLRLLNHIPLIICSIISYSLGYISLRLMYSQIFISSQWVNSDTPCYEILNLNIELGLISFLVYYMCDKFKLNVIKTFFVLGLSSVIIRCGVIVYFHQNNKLTDLNIRFLYDTNVFTQFYHFAFGFIFSEFRNKFKRTPKMLYNQIIQPKIIRVSQEFNTAVKYIIPILQFICVYVDSMIQIKYETENKPVQLMICRLLSKPVYDLLMWVKIVTNEIQFEQKCINNQQTDKKKVIIPGYNIHFITLLAAQPLCAILKVAVGHTVIGPYHPYLFVLMTIGVVVVQDILAQIIMKLFKWFMQDLYHSCLSFFDGLKRKRISILIKESIYTGCE